MEQTSITDGANEAVPYTHWGWQNEVRNSAIARDQVPGEQENSEGEKSKSESFGHVFTELRNPRRARRVLSSLREPQGNAFLFLAGASSSFGQLACPHAAQRDDSKTKTPRIDSKCGARNQTSVESETNKNPENKLRFRGLKSNQTRVSLSPSFIQTVTVGSGITPDHA
jgi:hypothetical protein